MHCCTVALLAALHHGREGCRSARLRSLAHRIEEDVDEQRWVAFDGRVLVQMWPRSAQSRDRCGGGEPSPGASGSTGGPSPGADEDTWTELQGMPPCAMLIEIIRAHARAGARMNSCTRDARGARDSSARAGCRRQHETDRQITDRNAGTCGTTMSPQRSMLQPGTPCCDAVHPVATRCNNVQHAVRCRRDCLGRAGGRTVGSLGSLDASHCCSSAACALSITKADQSAHSTRTRSRTHVPKHALAHTCAERARACERCLIVRASVVRQRASRAP